MSKYVPRPQQRLLLIFKIKDGPSLKNKKKEFSIIFEFWTFGSKIDKPTQGVNKPHSIELSYFAHPKNFEVQFFYESFLLPVDESTSSI